MKYNQARAVNFKNTEIAFRGKTNADLREALLLFKMMNSPRLVNIGKKLISIAFAIRFPVEWIVKRTIYKHFCGGVSILDSSKLIDKLNERNVGTILDYAVEGEENEEMFDETCREVKRTISFAHSNKKTPYSAFKITGIGPSDLMEKVSNNESLNESEKVSYDLLLKRIDDICKLGYDLKIPVLIDAEESWIQPMFDSLMLDMMRKYNKESPIVQNTYQMYRIDRLRIIKEHHAIAQAEGFKMGLKIVRGAYMEKERARAEEMGYPSPIQPNKEATDRDFNDSMRYFVKHIDDICFMVATHNEESCLLLTKLMDEHDLPRNHPNIYFSQLYGMGDHLTYNLAEQGYNVAKYVPYGEVKTMIPYLIRRAEENTSVAGQSSRELLLIKQEMKRRSKLKVKN
ncbi:MAG TPA: proline dehydrogenase family protein [Dysgonamonadaceae bacterium]|nr:proline dehydrogenase family protein [Dysgonamonadaceae bacterium]